MLPTDDEELGLSLLTNVVIEAQGLDVLLGTFMYCEEVLPYSPHNLSFWGKHGVLSVDNGSGSMEARQLINLHSLPEAAAVRKLGHWTVGLTPRISEVRR